MSLSPNRTAYYIVLWYNNYRRRKQFTVCFTACKYERSRSWPYGTDALLQICLHTIIITVVVIIINTRLVHRLLRYNPRSKLSITINIFNYNLQIRVNCFAGIVTYIAWRLPLILIHIIPIEYCGNNRILKYNVMRLIARYCQNTIRGGGWIIKVRLAPTPGIDSIGSPSDSRLPGAVPQLNIIHHIIL